MTSDAQRSAKYRANHPGRNAENTRRYRERHPERSKKSSLDYYHRNKEARDAYGKARYYDDPSKQRESSRRWRHKYPEKSRDYLQRKRAKYKLAPTYNCTDKIREIRSTNTCHWCGRDAKTEVDHVVPLNRGGAHHPNNLVASCRICNAAKGDKLYWEWDGELAA